MIQLRLRADTEGDKNFGVRTAGAAGNFGADENSLTMNAQTSSIPLVGRVWAPPQCSPRASETAPINPRVTRPTPPARSRSPPASTPPAPSIPEGTEVIFRADGIRIGTATVGSDGVATIEHSFDAAGPKRITALVEKREVDGRVYPRAESEAAVLTVAAPAGQDTTADLTYTRPDVDVEAEVLNGDLIRFIATVDAGDSTIEEGATVSFFDGSTFLGTAPVDLATGQAVFDHRFAERGRRLRLLGLLRLQLRRLPRLGHRFPGQPRDHRHVPDVDLRPARHQHSAAQPRSARRAPPHHEAGRSSSRDGPRVSVPHPARRTNRN